MYYYDDDGYPVAMMPVGYMPVGRTVDDRRGGSSGRGRSRGRGLVSTRPRSDTPTRVTLEDASPSQRQRIERQRIAVPQAEGQMRILPYPPPSGAAPYYGDSGARPYFGDSADDIELARALERERAILAEAQERARIEADIEAIRKQRAQLAITGVPTAGGGALGGSARALVHGSAVYQTEVPVFLNVAAGATGELLYTVNRYIRPWRILAQDATTRDNFTVQGFQDNGRELRENYAQGGGLPASFFVQDDEQLSTVLPWIASNHRFTIRVTNNDVAAQTARFIIQAVESELDPSQFDAQTAEAVDQFFNRVMFK